MDLDNIKISPVIKHSDTQIRTNNLITNIRENYEFASELALEY